MTIAALASGLSSFLSSPSPSVIALTGSCGSGKTYYWRDFLNSHSSSIQGCTNSCYVSLFGLENLQSLKNAIFASAVPIASGASPPDARSLRDRISEFIEGQPGVSIRERVQNWVAHTPQCYGGALSSDGGRGSMNK